MPGKRAKRSRQPGGVQKWILAVLKDAGPTGNLSTAKIAKRIAKSSGKRYHPNSVYTALRILTKQGAIKATRKGLEKSYSIATGQRGGTSRVEAITDSSSSSAAPEMASARIEAATPESIRLAAGLPHKLAPLEILVFPIRDGHVLVATNLHGRLVFERHKIPR